MNKNNKMITCYNVGQPSNEFEPYTQNGGVSPTLLSRMGTGGNQVPIVHCLNDQGGKVMDVSEEKTGTLRAEAHGHAPAVYSMGHDERSAQFTPNKTVRRLTPLEAERLMGLPDYWTDVEINGNPAPDSKRYKAIGNGMAVPWSDFILKRIVEVADNGKS